MTDTSASPVVAVVDDDQSILCSLEALLESADYSVRVFPSGPRLLRSACLPGIACLISDIDMPDMDGIKLLRLVHEVRPGLPTILITAYPEALKRIPLAGEPRPQVLIKPYVGAELLTAVRDALKCSPR